MGRSRARQNETNTHTHTRGNIGEEGEERSQEAAEDRERKRHKSARGDGNKSALAEFQRGKDHAQMNTQVKSTEHPNNSYNMV